MPAVETEIETAKPSSRWSNFKKSLGEDLKPIEQQIKVEAEPETTPEKPAEKPAETKPVEQPAKPATPETKPDPDEEIASGKRHPKSDDFKRVKQTAKEFEKKFVDAEKARLELDKQLQEAKKSPAQDTNLIKSLTEDRDKAASERDKLKTLYNEIALEFNPEFHQKYKAQKEKALVTLKTNVPKEIADQLEKLFDQPDSELKRKQIIELVSDMDDVQRDEVLAANRAIQFINMDRQSELSNAESKLTGIIQERQASNQRRAQAMKKSFESVIDELKDPQKGVAGFRFREEKSDEDRTYNAAVKERIEVARAYYEGLDDDSERARMVSWAALAPELMAQLKSAQAEIANRDEVISKLQGASPDLKGGSVTARQGARKSFKEAVTDDIVGRS